MNDEETVALIAGGHTFGKTHGAGDADLVGPEPEGAPLEEQGLGWKSALRLRQGRRRHHLRPRGHLDHARRRGGATTSSRSSSATSGSSPRARPAPTSGSPRTPRRSSPARRADSPKRKPTMLTSDLALRFDPAYEKISRRFLENPDEFALAFAKAWYKLLHRDMGPVERYLGPWVAGAAAVAGPGAGRRRRARRRRRRRRAQGEGARLRPVGLRARLHRVGLGRELPLHRQARWRQRRPHPPRAAARLGGQPARAARAPSSRSSRASRREFNARRRRADLAGRPDRAGRLRGGREGRQGRRRRGDRAVPRRAAPTPRRSRPTSTRSRCSSRGPTGSATTCGPARSCSRRRCWSTGPTCSTSPLRR